MVQIRCREYSIYSDMLVDNNTLEELYNKEQILTNFKTKVNTMSHYPFATFLAKERHLTNLRINGPLIIKAVKDNKKFEFVSKLCKWGKFSVSKEAVKLLDMKNHEIIKFEIIKENKNQEIKNNCLDLAGVEDVDKIFREDNFITLYKTGGTAITLPRFIEITLNLIELSFLIHGDGSYKEKLYFVNKNPELHIFVIDKFYEIFKIPKEVWRARLLFNNASDSFAAKEKWKHNLDLKEEQFYPSISKCVLNTSEFGNLRIVIDKLIVARVFRHVFEQIKKSKDYPIHALNGLLCAEGGARKTKHGLHKITLSFSQKEKEMFESILKSVSLSEISKVSQNSRFCIEGWENLHLFFKTFYDNKCIPFDIHSQRCKNALGGFLDHGFTKTMEKYLNALNKKDNFTIKEIMNELNHRDTSVLGTLRKKQYSKFIKIEGKGVNRNPFKISITQEGRDFLTLTKNMREVYNAKCEDNTRTD